MRAHFDWLTLAYTIALLVIVTIAIVLAVRECNAKERCRYDGGHVEQYGCHWIVTGKTVIRSCNWRCADLPAERAP